MNDYRTKKIIVDSARGLIVRQLFEIYVTGRANFDDLREFLAQNGVRTKNGKLLTRQHMRQILANPFYYGHFRYAGEVYEGKARSDHF